MNLTQTALIERTTNMKSVEAKEHRMSYEDAVKVYAEHV